MGVTLKESMKMEWSGDVDLNTGAVSKVHSEYRSYLKFLDAVGVGERRNQPILVSDLKQLQKDLETHLIYLSSSKNLTCIILYL